MALRRSEAARRHRRFLAILASMLAALIVLVVFAAPAVDDAFQKRGRATPAMTRALSRTGRFIAERPVRFGLLGAAVLGLAWSTFSFLDRPRNR